jgi:hypothetical protein
MATAPTHDHPGGRHGREGTSAVLESVGLKMQASDQAKNRNRDGAMLSLIFPQARIRSSPIFRAWNTPIGNPLTLGLLYGTGSSSTDGITDGPTLALAADPGETVTLTIGTVVPTTFAVGWAARRNNSPQLPRLPLPV